MRITVLGSGSWGTAVANILAHKGHKVCLLGRDPEAMADITARHENKRYLPGIALAPTLTATADAEKAFAQAEVCLLAVPAQSLAENLCQYADMVPPSIIPICLSKGIEIATNRRMSQVVAECWPFAAERYAIFSGPSFAQETACGLPTAVVLASANQSLCERLREELSYDRLRIYSSQDVLGVEIGGACKNIIAIAAGVCDGLELGTNARAALITRGLAEITRLGVKLGAHPTTFMGLSGMGDLVLTCTGALSRNRSVGLELGKGKKLADILSAMHNVAEGVPTTKAVYKLAQSVGVETPIAKSMYKVLYEESSPAQEVDALLARTLKDE